MRGNYASPSELLLALRETGKSYWDLIGKPLNQNTGYNLNNPHAAEEKQYNEWYDSLKLSDEDNIKLQQLLSEYDKNFKSNTDNLPKYKKGKDKFRSFAALMGPRIYRELHKLGIYSSNTYDNMMRQLAWESNYANSLNAINNHNYAGIRRSATKYAKYKNDDLFAQEYVSLIKRKYPNAVKAKNPVLYAKALKDNGYYEDSVEHYAQSLAAMSSISNAVKAHMAANPDQYEVEVLLEDLKKQSELPAVSTRVAKPINREPINKEPFVNTPIPTEAPLITRPEYLESNSLIKKSFELNMNNMLLGKELLFKLPGFKKGKNSKKPLSDEQYFKIMEDVANENYKNWGLPNQDAALLKALNDNRYDYRGYYNKYPTNYANSSTHWTDEFKTVYHPTFSDESKYSGYKNKYNPDGIVGGHWYNETFVPSFDQLAKRNKLPNKFKGGKDGNLLSTYSLGRRYWQAQSNAPTILEKKNAWVKQQKKQQDRKVNALRKYFKTEGYKKLNKEVKDNLTTSNSTIWTTANKNPKNPHLLDKVTKGAKAHASWEKEHPVLTKWGNVLGAAPFAVASAPLAAAIGSGAVALGDAAAATAIGQGVTNFLTPIAGTSIAGASIPQWFNLGLMSASGAHGIQTSINEGGVSPTTALELSPLAKLIKPTVEIGHNATKPVVNKVATELQNRYPALFDPYTSWDATLGNHGNNIFSRAVGTIGRKYGYTPKAEIPEFHRRLNINEPGDMRITDDGKLIISSGRKGNGHDGIVNFATSEPARSHRSHKMLSSVDDYIINPKAIGTQNFKSILPSDTFFETGQLAIDPKNITLISGNIDVLNQARSIGIKTLSSPRLRKLKADTAPISKGGTGLLARIDYSHSGNDGQIGTEIQRLASMRGTPTIKDYAYFEDMTGLNSGVIPKTKYNLENAPTILGRWGNVRRLPIFNNVIYDPATNIEALYRRAKIGERPWSDYYEGLKKMPSARQQL